MFWGIRKNQNTPLVKVKSCWRQSRLHWPAHAKNRLHNGLIVKIKKSMRISIGGFQVHIFVIYVNFLSQQYPILQWVLPALQTKTFIVHPACFSYVPESSVKGPAENDVVNLMMEEILTDGFITSGEPLMLLQSIGLSNGPYQAAGMKICSYERLAVSSCFEHKYWFVALQTRTE